MIAAFIVYVTDPYGNLRGQLSSLWSILCRAKEWLAFARPGPGREGSKYLVIIIIVTF